MLTRSLDCYLSVLKNLDNKSKALLSGAVQSDTRFPKSMLHRFLCKKNLPNEIIRKLTSLVWKKRWSKQNLVAEISKLNAYKDFINYVKEYSSLPVDSASAIIIKCGGRIVQNNRAATRPPPLQSNYSGSSGKSSASGSISSSINSGGYGVFPLSGGKNPGGNRWF